MSDERSAARRTGPALEKMYQFLLWLVPTLEKFPRSQRFLLGDRIQSTAMDALEGLIEATYTAKRSPILRRVNIRLEKLRYLMGNDSIRRPCLQRAVGPPRLRDRVGSSPIRGHGAGEAGTVGPDSHG